MYDARPNKINGGRSSYFLICSIYKDSERTYLGIFKKNFRVDKIFYSVPSADEKADAEKAVQDSIAAAEQAFAASESAMMDSATFWTPDPRDIIAEDSNSTEK